MRYRIPGDCKKMLHKNHSIIVICLAANNFYTTQMIVFLSEEDTKMHTLHRTRVDTAF